MSKTLCSRFGLSPSLFSFLRVRSQRRAPGASRLRKTSPQLWRPSKSLMPAAPQLMNEDEKPKSCWIRSTLSVSSRSRRQYSFCRARIPDSMASLLTARFSMKFSDLWKRISFHKKVSASCAGSSRGRTRVHFRLNSTRLL